MWRRSSRKSLDYTKQSLRISIDLGKREEESETWLQVGRIYYLIHEDELADMYLQVREKIPIELIIKFSTTQGRHLVVDLGTAGGTVTDKKVFLGEYDK